GNDLIGAGVSLGIHAGVQDQVDFDATFGGRGQGGEERLLVGISGGVGGAFVVRIGRCVLEFVHLHADDVARFGVVDHGACLVEEVCFVAEVLRGGATRAGVCSEARGGSRSSDDRILDGRGRGTGEGRFGGSCGSSVAVRRRRRRCLLFRA